MRTAGCTPATSARWTRRATTHVEGRLKDYDHPRRREHLSPEIEEFIYTHPEVSDVQVVGVPDKKYGEEVIAFVVPRPGAKATEQDIIAFVKDGLRQVQGPPLRHVHRRLPHDRQRQDPEMQAAGDRRGAPEPPRGRQRRDRVKKSLPKRRIAPLFCPGGIANCKGLHYTGAIEETVGGFIP